MDLRSLRDWMFVILLSVYALQMVFQILPPGNLQDRLNAPFKSVVDFLGLNQRFAVFAPAVPKFNLHVRALVYLKDGTYLLWDFPRLEEMSLGERFRKHGLRKWSHDNMLDPARSGFVLPDACRYIARQVKAKNLEPVWISIIEYRWRTPGPGETSQYDLKPRTIYVYRVSAGDLQ